MRTKSIFLTMFCAASFSGTSHAIQDNRLSVYTGVAGAVGGLAAGALSSDMGGQKSAGIGLLVGAACSVLGYLVLKGKTATARYQEANITLEHVARYPAFAHVPHNDGQQRYGQADVVALQGMVDHADVLLKKAFRDTPPSDGLRNSDILSKQQQVEGFKRVINHMYAHVNHDQVKASLDEISADPLMQSGVSGNYVQYVRKINVRQQYPLLGAFSALARHDDVLKSNKHALNGAWSMAFHPSKLKEMIEEQQRRLFVVEQSAIGNMYTLKQDPSYTDEESRHEQFKLASDRIEAERSKAHAAHRAAEAEQIKAAAKLSQAQAEHDRNKIEWEKLRREEQRQREQQYAAAPPPLYHP